MPVRRQARPTALYVLLAGLLFQGVSGVAGGIGLIGDPTGRSVGLPLDWLEGSPFADYLIPGLVLFSALGVSPLIVAYGLWRRLFWAWPAVLVVGAALVVWIGVEILVVGYHAWPPLQLVYGLLGVALLVLALLPSVRRDSAAYRKHAQV